MNEQSLIETWGKKRPTSNKKTRWDVRECRVPGARFKVGIHIEEITRNKGIQSLDIRLFGKLQVNIILVMHKNIGT